jgi:hypothetical protein
MKLAPTMILFISLSVLLPPILSGLACAQEDGSWMEEPWNDAASSGGLSASAMQDILPFNITGKEPKAFRLASSEVDYRDYISRNRSNELWVRSNITWTQYLQAYQGDRIELVAYAPTGGSADLYSIYYTLGNISHRGYNLLPGYYHMNISAFEPGRVMLIFAVDDQPANAVMIDVLPQEAEAASGPVAVESVLPDKARVIIQSSNVKDYDVFVDGAFYSSDIGDGASDGVASFTLNGDGMHTITISKRDSLSRTTYKSEHKREFKGGYTYRLNI